ncbi:hypothetical protein KSK37_06355 [Kaistella sp. DKR-2]|uniref:LIC_10190 family membrane protein n=1 Tax=Kaistella soli TaxID=2849654 RepID=UPI001C26F09A|nr:hypothetical protein [Kaistella soli]
MLYIVFSLIILIPVLAGYGAIFQKFFGKIFGGFSSKLLSGIFLVSVIWTGTALFYPLNINIEIVTVILGLSAFFYFRIYRELRLFKWRNCFTFFFISFITVFAGSGFPFILDHFGYYVPTVKWISEFGLVQGISNLDLLLGQMSVWHILQAGFSNFSDPFLRLNVIVLILYLIYIFEKKSWIHLVFLPVLFLFSQSPSPDLPVIVFALIVLNEILFLNKNVGSLFAFSVFIFMIKPTVIWLPILVFLYSVLILKSNLKFMLPGVLLLGLFVFKNIWTFGFPVFPVQFLDLGLSWKPAAGLLKNSSQMAIMKTFDMNYQYGDIVKFSTFDYIKNWLFLNGIKGWIHQSFIISLIVLLIFAVRRKSKIIWLIFISVGFKSILILLFSAQYRFFIDVFFVVFFVLFYQTFSKRFAIMTFTVLSVICGVFLSFPNLVKNCLPSFRLGTYMTGFSKNQFYKPSCFELKKYKTHQIGNLKFNIVAQYPFSFDTPLPAISPQFIREDLDAGIFPKLKGKTLKDGFIWRKISNEEKTEIKKILQKFPAENHE